MSLRERAAGFARVAQIDLSVCILVTLAAVLATLSDLPLLLRLPLDGALVLFLPGYALYCAMVIARGLSVLERVLVAVAASIGLTIAVGFGLAAVGMALDRVNWATALGGITIGLAIVAWIRRGSRGIVVGVPHVPGMPLHHFAMAVLALLVFADAVLGSRWLAGAQLGNPPEQLWLLANGSSAASLGMRADSDGGSYVVRVSSAGNVVEEYELALGPSEIWQAGLALNATEAQLPLVARLYVAGTDSEIRFVILQPPAAPTDGS